MDLIFFYITIGKISWVNEGLQRRRYFGLLFDEDKSSEIILIMTFNLKILLLLGLSIETIHGKIRRVF